MSTVSHPPSDAEVRLAQLQAAMEQVNGLLGDITPYKLAVVRPADLQPAPLNAHFMPKAVFDTLKGNIERDGNLSSLPFCWKRGEGDFLILSGHHRAEAAKTAGVPYILILFTDTELSEGQRIATQLSHNALVGQDNPTQLRELWNQIDRVEWKVYSGLDDAKLATMQPVQVARFADQALRFEELVLQFLPAETERIKDVLERLGRANRHRFAADVADWDRFFDGFLSFKEATGIYNSATAFKALIEIAATHVAQLEAEAAQAQADALSEGEPGSAPAAADNV